MEREKPKDLGKLRADLDINPGEFYCEQGVSQEEVRRILNEARGMPDDFVLSTPEETYGNATPSFSDDLIQGYELFRDRIYSPKRVLYPSCDLDASPVKAFPESYVVLVDINEHVVNALKRGGINAVHSDIRNYVPEEKFDLAILLNPCIDSSDITPFLSERAYVLANDWHENARQLVWNPDFESIGTIEQIPRKIDKDRWGHKFHLISGEMKDLGRVADNFWIFRSRK